jgi:hypothetical protein
MYKCSIPNGFRDKAISLYSSKIVHKKEILRTVSNTGIFLLLLLVGWDLRHQVLRPLLAYCTAPDDR